MRTIHDTIATYDTEKGTTLQTHVVRLFEYCELSDEARGRAVANYIEERENDPCFWQDFANTRESDIWACVRDLEQGITGARVSWKYNPWYSCDFDCVYAYDDCYDPGEIETVDDNGYYASMDLCDVWNEHARRLNALFYRFEYVDELMYRTYPYYDHYCNTIDENETFYGRLDDMHDNLVSMWYEELERACEHVRDTIEILLREEWEYYTSEEYARLEFEDLYAGGEFWRTRDDSGRVYISDSRKWYTAAGELYEQSDGRRQCVSIVKAS